MHTRLFNITTEQPPNHERTAWETTERPCSLLEVLHSQDVRRAAGVIPHKVWGPPLHTCCLYLFINYYYYWLILGGERKISICCSTHLYIHGLVFVQALTRDWTHNVGMLGRCSYPLSYLARAQPRPAVFKVSLCQVSGVLCTSGF